MRPFFVISGNNGRIKLQRLQFKVQVDRRPSLKIWNMYTKAAQLVHEAVARQKEIVILRFRIHTRGKQSERDSASFHLSKFCLRPYSLVACTLNEFIIIP